MPAYPHTHLDFTHSNRSTLNLANLTELFQQYKYDPPGSPGHLKPVATFEISVNSGSVLFDESPILFDAGLNLLTLPAATVQDTF
nr:MAG TPA: hypothetical protein [Caudoviricetes sp.]